MKTRFILVILFKKLNIIQSLQGVAMFFYDCCGLKLLILSTFFKKLQSKLWLFLALFPVLRNS